MRPVDAHCHLDFEQYSDDREDVIGRAREKLEFVVNAGSNPEHNMKALELEEETDGFVKANLGLHPTYTESFDELEKVKKQIRSEKPAAVGEIGLDFHHVTDQDIRERQEEVFRELLELAEEVERPVVLHTRDAEKQALKILEDYSLEGVMLHCFNGSPELAVEASRKGYLIGVTTQVLYSERVRSIVQALELKDIVLETDSPFLYRGERNEPVNVVESAERIAEIKDVPVDEVIDVTTGSAQEFFGLTGGIKKADDE